MLLTMALLLALASAYLEVKIAKAFPKWHEWSVKYTWFNLGGSLALSYTLGILFGASGLIALMAGIISTVISIPYYEYLRYKETNKDKIEENKQILKDAGRGVWSFIRFIGLPFRLARSITNFFARRGAALP